MKSRRFLFTGITVVILAVVFLVSYQANAQCPTTVVTPLQSPVLCPLSTPMPLETNFCEQNRFDVNLLNRPAPDLNMLMSPPITNQNMLNSLITLGNCSAFMNAVRNAGLESQLQNGNFTVFVPTNQAFNMLPPIPWQNLQLPENQDRLNRIMSYHIVPGPVSFTGADENDQLRYTTLEGSQVILRQVKGMYFVENSQILNAYRTNNGVIYVIDTVMIPTSTPTDFLSTEKVDSKTDIEMKHEQIR